MIKGMPELNKSSAFGMFMFILFIGYLFYKESEVQELRKSKGLVVFNQMQKDITPDNKYYLYKSSQQASNNNWSKTGLIGGSIANCIKTSEPEIHNFSSGSEKTYLEVDSKGKKYYFEFNNVRDDKKIGYATLLIREQDGYGYRSIRSLKLDCFIEDLK